MSHLPLTLDQAVLSSESAQSGRHLWSMSRAEKVAAMWRGDLSFAECQAWSRRRPDEVPLLGHEFAYIVLRTPEWLGD